MIKLLWAYHLLISTNLIMSLNSAFLIFLRYNLKDYSFTVLYYQKGVKLTDLSSEEMAKLAEYLKYDNELHAIHIESFTDAYGARTANQYIARQRAKNLRNFFIRHGIPKNKIHMKTNVMKRYVARNNKSSERAKNRRVVLRIIKSVNKLVTCLLGCLKTGTLENLFPNFQII